MASLGRGGEAAKNVLQHPTSFEHALQRHGQYVLWYSGQPCYCMDNDGVPDENHAKCLGRGTLYYPVESIRVLEEHIGSEGNTVTVNGPIAEVLRVYKGRMTDLAVVSINGNTITLAAAVRKYERITVDYTKNVVGTFVGKATVEDHGILRVAIQDISPQGFFPGAITEVSALMNNTQGGAMNVDAFWENMILSSSPASIGDDIDVTCKYITALRFLITGLNPMQNIQNTMMGETIDASATFPGAYQVGAGDILTLLKAESRTSMVGQIKSDADADTYKLPFFHVSSILRVEDQYGVVAGARIIRNNEILWTGVRRPRGKFSINLTYHPSFLVQVNLPNMRYAEDKIFPRKVSLKRYDQWFGRNEVRPSVRQSQGKWTAASKLIGPTDGAEMF